MGVPSALRCVTLDKFLSLSEPQFSGNDKGARPHRATVQMKRAPRARRCLAHSQLPGALGARRGSPAAWALVPFGALCPTPGASTPVRPTLHGARSARRTRAEGVPSLSERTEGLRNRPAPSRPRPPGPPMPSRCPSPRTTNVDGESRVRGAGPAARWPEATSRLACASVLRGLPSGRGVAERLRCRPQKLPGQSQGSGTQLDAPRLGPRPGVPVLHGAGGRSGPF